MTPNDSTPGPLEDAEPLSATGMFLRAFDSPATPSPEPPKAPVTTGGSVSRADWGAEIFNPPSPIVAASAPPPAGKPGSPGEFTQMFQTLEPRPTPTPIAPSAPTPSSPVQSYAVQSVPVLGAAPPAAGSASPAPGEFTRIFVGGSVPAGPSASSGPSLDHPAKTVLETPLASPQGPAPARMKGFSSPGISDSASAEGSFTQFFKAATPAPAAAPPAQVHSFSPPPAPPSPVQEKPWQPEPSASPVFSSNADAKPASAFSGNAEPSSATGMLSSMASSPSYSARTSASDPWQAPPVPPKAESFPAFTPTPVPAEPPAEAGGVTRLIQRLSQVPQAPPEPYTPPAPAAPPPVSAGPGEFTRMISGEALRAATGAAAPPPAAPPATAAPGTPAFSVPVSPIPQPVIPKPALQVPVAPAPAVPSAPAFPPAPAFAVPAPQIAAPKPPAPSAVAAAPPKPDSMVRILLIVNLFLTLIVLLVVLFAMKAK